MSSDENPGEVRRIQVTGRGSYIVSLPKRWVKERRLDRGEQVIMTTEDDGSLLISPRATNKRTEALDTTIIVSNNLDLEALSRRIVSLYLTGFNYVRIKTTEARFGLAQSDFIRDFARRNLVGTEVVTESPKEVELQVLISYPELSVENALRRMVTITLSMLRDAISALAKKDETVAAEVVNMDDEVDRFGFYLVRQLKTAAQGRVAVRQIGLGSGRDIIGYRLVAKSVERAADHAAKIAQNVSLMKQTISTRLSERLVKMGEQATKIFEDAMISLYKRSYAEAENVLQRMNQFENLEREIIMETNRQKMDPVQMSSLRLIIESLGRVGEYGSDIAEVVLNLTVANST
jgi:phosphate uptake regulator